MTTEAQILRSIRGAASRRKRAEAEKRQATEDLRGFCQQAQKAGVSITRIASDAGLSRQGVYDLLGERLSS
jgi:DNA-binding phage protein